MYRRAFRFDSEEIPISLRRFLIPGLKVRLEGFCCRDDVGSRTAVASRLRNTRGDLVLVPTPF